MRWGLAAGLVAFGATAATAGEVPLYQAAPDWVAPAPAITPAQLAAGAPAMVVLDQQLRLQDGQVWRYVDTATRIATPEMLSQAGTLTLTWQPDKGDLYVHRLQIVRGAETIDLLAGGRRLQVIRREQKLEQRELSGELTATMPVEGLRVGDVLRVVISDTNRDAALRGQVQSAVGLAAAPARIGYFRSRILWPAKDEVRWKAYTDAAKPVLTTAGGYRQLLVEGVLPKPAELPGDMPVRLAKPLLVEATSFADWPAVSRTMAPLYATDGTIAPGSPLAAEVARIKAAASDPLGRTALALALVQDQVRYLYNGMAGGNYTPQRPADTWSLRYGDCKAKTLLLLSLLRALDVEAEAAIAPAEAGDLFDGRLPSPSAFDHVIVRATVGGETLWLDGTGGGTKLSDIRDVPTFRTVLPLRAAGAEPMAVPFRAPARPALTLAIDVDQRAGVTMPALVRMDAELRGPVGAMIGLVESQANDEQKRQMAQQLVGKVMDDVRITGQTLAYDPVTGVGRLSATGLATTPWSTDRGRRRMPLDRALAEMDFKPDRGRAAWRAIPVSLGAPTRIRYATRVHLPAGGKGFTLAGDETLSEVIAGRQVTRRAVLAGDLITVDDEVVSVAPEIAPDALAATRARVALAQNRKLEAVAPGGIPSRAAEALAARKAGTLKPLLAAYDKAIAAAPEEADAYLSRARLQAGVYDYAAAIPDLTKALAIAPDADTYLWRAQLYRLGGDDKRRLADIQEAAKLEPDAIGSVGAMAEYKLDHGDSDGALAMVQERIDAGGKEALNFQLAKADLLARAGDAAGAVALLDTVDKANPGNAGVLNSRCWIKGTMNVQLDSAVRDCTRAIELADNGAAALDSRAMVYYRLGRVDDAMADLAAALERAPDQAGSRYLRAVLLGKQGKAADARDDVSAARLMAPLIDQEYGRWGIKP